MNYQSLADQLAASARDTGEPIAISTYEASVLVTLADIGLQCVLATGDTKHREAAAECLRMSLAVFDDIHKDHDPISLSAILASVVAHGRLAEFNVVRDTTGGGQ